ncbi:MAG: site-specific integrase, partial [Gammaproteobacteria bacterium]
IRGRRLCESTGTRELKEAEACLAKRIEELRQTTVYGVRPRRTFRAAATKYLNETRKRSLGRDAQDLRAVDAWIGELPLQQVHTSTLRPFIEARRQAGVKSATVNRTLAVVRRVLNLAARLWRDDNGLTWLETPPLIPLEDWEDQRAPHPLSWDEQDRLFRELPAHLQRMALFKVNTGKEKCADYGGIGRSLYRNSQAVYLRYRGAR